MNAANVARFRRGAVASLVPVALLTVAAGALRHIEPPAMRGFTAASAERERTLEAELARRLDRDSTGAILKYLTAQPHPAGSVRNKVLADFVAARYRQYGLEDVRVHRYDVLLPWPRTVTVEMTAPTRYVASLKEDAFPRDPQTAQDAGITYLGMSASGDVTGELVYASSGNPSDYDWLESHGVSLKGKIAIVRYSLPYSYRGFKALTAQQRGLAAILIYSDPAQDGFVKGDTFPVGPWGPSSHIQRGAITYDFLIAGDPLTPGYASLPGAPRIKPEDAPSVPKIIAVPMSYRDAEPLLRALGGPEAPREWQGALGFTYHVGGGPALVHVKVDMDQATRPIYVVEGRIRGTDEPDKFVLLGNHRDAWVFGAVDPSSGTATQLELARVLGAMAREGKRPRRSIVFADWDAEEWHLTGSTEWGENFADDVKRNAIAYLNVDGSASGSNFEVGAVASLNDVVTETVRDVKDPAGPGSVRDAWKGHVANALGSGSDYTVFLNFLGVPVVEMDFDGPYGVYHSVYDDYYWMSHFGDPGFRYMTAMSEIWGRMAMRLANADAYPYDFAAYAASVGGFIDSLAAQPSVAGQLDLSAARAATRRWAAAAASLDSALATTLSAPDGPARAARLRAANDAMRAVEQRFLNDSGIPGRPWFRHVLYAPKYTYAAMALPGVQEAVDAGDWTRARAQLAIVAAKIDAAASATRGAVDATLLRSTPPPGAVQHAGAPLDPRLYAALSWRNLGPFRAGRVSAVSGVIGQAGVFYAGFPGGGLWKTTSAGQVWFPVFDAVKEVSSVGAVEVAPSDPEVVYVGTGDMITGGTLDQGNGVYKSTDAGATWQSMGLQGTRHIQTLLVDPRNPDVVLVGALGDHVHANGERGVYRSTDGGRTWSRTLFIDDSTGIAKLANAFDVPDVIFATSMRHWTPPGYAVGKYRSWQFGTALRAPGDSSPNGTEIYKSLDGGVTWTKLSGPTVPRVAGRTSIAVAIGTSAQRVYVISDAGLWRSDDGGSTWQRMATDDQRIRSGQGGYSSGVWVDPKNPDVVYTINTASYKSVDGGRTFTGMNGAPGGDDPQQLWIDPSNGQRMLMGLDQGATVSLDGGATWSSWYNQSTEQLYHISADNSWPYWVYAAQQDAGSIRTRSRGNNGAVTIFDWNSVNGWEWGTDVADPLDPSIVYASGAGVVRISYPTEQTINVSPTQDPTLKWRLSQSQPLLFAPWNQHLLLAGFNYLYGTTDGGAHWTRMSPDLGVPQGMDSVAGARRLGGYGAIESIAASTLSPGEIWVGTDNGMIHLTRDAGRTWHDVSIAGLTNPRVANITSVEASHGTRGTAYAAVEYLRSGDHRPYLFRTRDWGKTWTLIVNGLPTDEPSGSFARVLREDPRTPGLLFAGTESGIHVSFDAGDHWQSLQLNLPNTPVRDLVVKDNDLLIATHGRGAWVLDDIGLLRQLRTGGDSVSSKAAYLFAPSLAIRVRRNTNQDTPLHAEIPHADNPPDGAVLDYWLGRAADQVAIDVLDGAGRVVRHYDSNPITPVTEAARPPHPNFWVFVPRPLSATAGAHRVNWDLRYDDPPAFTHSFEINANPGLTPASPQGPLAAPGTYTVRLTANGVTATRPLVVRNDPRSTATSAAIAQQLALQLRIVEAMRAAWNAQQQLDSLRPPLDSASRPDFRRLNGTLANLLNAQDNADWAPNAQMRAAFARACSDLQAALRKLPKAVAAPDCR